MPGALCHCGEPATANGRECPAHFLERLRSIRVDTQGWETAERDGTYYDAEPIRQVFGDDARERMLEETAGLGYARTGPDGELYHRDRHSGDIVPVDERKLDDVYLGGRTARENR